MSGGGQEFWAFRFFGHFDRVSGWNERQALTPKNDPPAGAVSATGTPGLDQILGGGFSPNRVYLVEGDRGSGKTTLALRYLLEGARVGEAGLYVTLSETKEEINAVA